MVILGGLHTNAHRTVVETLIFKRCTSKVDTEGHKNIHAMNVIEEGR